MSIAALLKATRNIIWEGLQLDDKTCDIMPGPKPKPSCGQRFLSVWMSSWSPGDQDLNRGIDEYYTITCTWSYRSGYAPIDLQGGEIYIKHLEGIEAATRSLLPLIHQNIELMTAANNLIQDSSYKIVEPFRWLGGDAVPTIVGAEWFWSETDDKQAGFVQEIRFGNARRLQPINATNGIT